MMGSFDFQAFYDEVGTRIKIEREKQGLSQDSMAEYLDLTRASIINIEKGRHKPAIHVLVLIANFLNVDVMKLMPTKPISAYKNDVQFYDFKKIVTTDFDMDLAKNTMIKFISFNKKV